MCPCYSWGSIKSSCSKGESRQENRTGHGEGQDGEKQGPSLGIWPKIGCGDVTEPGGPRG